LDRPAIWYHIPEDSTPKRKQFSAWNPKSEPTSFQRDINAITLKMAVVSFSETPENFYETTQRHIPEDNTFKRKPFTAWNPKSQPTSVERDIITDSGKT
jgi:hypothetical protein